MRSLAAAVATSIMLMAAHHAHATGEPITAIASGGKSTVLLCDNSQHLEIASNPNAINHERARLTTCVEMPVGAVVYFHFVNPIQPNMMVVGTRSGPRQPWAVAWVRDFVTANGKPLQPINVYPGQFTLLSALKGVDRSTIPR